MNGAVNDRYMDSESAQLGPSQVNLDFKLWPTTVLNDSINDRFEGRVFAKTSW